MTQSDEKSTYYSHPSDLELDFLKSAEENYALIRAIYPWGEAYFYNNNTCLAVLAMGSEIVENNTSYTEPGTIVGLDINTKTIDILCGDNKVLRVRAENYRKCDRAFTKNYLKRELFVGDRVATP